MNGFFGVTECFRKGEKTQTKFSVLSRAFKIVCKAEWKIPNTRTW